MPSNRPVIAPLAIAYIQAHGPQTVEDLAAALGFGRDSVGKAVRNAADAGQLEIVARERVSNGSLRLRYGLPQPKMYPKLTAGEYIARMPSGTLPEDNRRVVT